MVFVGKAIGIASAEEPRVLCHFEGAAAGAAGCGAVGGVPREGVVAGAAVVFVAHGA